MELKETRYAVAGGVATITLDRPDHLNAFTTRMMHEMLDIIAEVDRDDDVRVAVITGEGRAFCAGADLSAGGSSFDAGAGYGKHPPERHRDGGGQVALALYRSRKPFIAAINGPAVGVGVTMTLAADVRVAAADAKIGFVFTRRGIVPEACSSWFLPRIVGRSKAAELFLTGRVFRASEEADSGLFNHVVPAQEVLERAYTIAREIADNTSAVSVALAKALLHYGAGQDHPYGTHLADSRCMHWAGSQADCREGVESFLEKRTPQFSMSAWKDMPEFYPWWEEPGR